MSVEKAVQMFQDQLFAVVIISLAEDVRILWKQFGIFAYSHRLNVRVSCFFTGSPVFKRKSLNIFSNPVFSSDTTSRTGNNSWPIPYSLPYVSANKKVYINIHGYISSDTIFCVGR